MMRRWMFRCRFRKEWKRNQERSCRVTAQAWILHSLCLHPTLSPRRLDPVTASAASEIPPKYRGSGLRHRRCPYRVAPNHRRVGESSSSRDCSRKSTTWRQRPFDRVLSRIRAVTLGGMAKSPRRNTRFDSSRFLSYRKTEIGRFCSIHTGKEGTEGP